MTKHSPQTEMDMTVPWGDSDPAGISYYAKSFDWFTNGRLHFLKCHHLPYMETFHDQGIALVCLHADCDYKKMVHPEEQLTIQTLLTELRRTRMTFTYRVFNAEDKLAQEGITRLAYTDSEGKPFNIEKRHPEIWKQLKNIWEQKG